MKYKYLSIAVSAIASILLFSTPAHAQGGQLVAAEYGEGGHRVDVTNRVRSFMHDGVLRFEVTDQMLGVDPARNHVKEIFIRIRHWDGKVEEFRFPEHARVNLEVDPDAGFEWHDRSLHIMRAYYGGEGAFVNVTERVQSMVRDGHISVLVDNGNMGGDPDPRVHKSLRVLYWFEGERRNVVVQEQNTLRLP
jgi:DnaJ-like protein